MPASTRPSPPAPRRIVRTITTTAVAAPPSSAPVPVLTMPPPRVIRASRAPVVAPRVKPTTSGLPSGLRATLWKTVPETASMPPTVSAAVHRGRRWSRIMKRAIGSPPPPRTSRSSEALTRKVPVASETAPITTAIMSAMSVTASERRCTRRLRRAPTTVHPAGGPRRPSAPPASSGRARPDRVRGRGLIVPS